MANKKTEMEPKQEDIEMEEEIVEEKPKKKKEEIETPKLTEEQRKKLIKQVKLEKKIAETHLSPKVGEYYRRLKLYNNQKRDKDKVGDPLLFTVHQTLLASLHDDRMAVTFIPEEEGDENMAENMALVAEFDYSEMEKDYLDYFWNWNALMFGRACILMMEYDRDRKVPVPQLLDPLTFLRDPDASSINGDNYGEASRFFGRPVRMSRLELKTLEEDEVYYNVDKLEASKSTGEETTTQAAQRARDEAQNRQDVSSMETSDLGDNEKLDLTEWFTHFDGMKVLVVLGNNDALDIRYEVIGEADDKFPAIDRACFPVPGDWDGVSVADLIEDKQRMKSVLLNLGIEVGRAALYPRYLYDQNRITNRGDLEDEAFTAIPVDGSVNDAVAPVSKAHVSLSEFDYLSNSLDAAAQRASATPELQQGVISKENRTASELNIVAAKVDTRYSLLAKMFAASEKRFWLAWMRLYKENFEDLIDTKVVRLVGELGIERRELTKEQFVTASDTDPDVIIESKILNEAKRIKALNNFTPFFQALMQDPEVNARFVKKKYGKLLGFKKDELELMLPRTAEEVRAMRENKALNSEPDAEKLKQEVVIKSSDDHMQHIAIHNTAKEGPAKRSHISAHYKAMEVQRLQQQKEAAKQAQAEQGGEPQAAEGGAAKPSMGGMSQLLNRLGGRKPSTEAVVQREDEQAISDTQEAVEQTRG